jgi:hypothetical protein
MNKPHPNAPYLETIRAAKRQLRAQIPDYKARFDDLTAQVKTEIDAIRSIRARGDCPVPEVAFEALDQITPAQRATIKQRGCVVIKGVFAQDTIDGWNRDIATYLHEVKYLERMEAKRGIDQYFSALASSKPQIYSVYWSKPQMLARQSPELARARQWLNRLWNFTHEGQPVFNPDQELTYVDRVRQRQPGDATLGLSPHCDGGTIERWIDPGYQQVYRHIFGGDLSAYDAFDAAYRTVAREIPSPAVCRMFRTFQGWTALTRQGPGDGTLNILPVANAVPWMLLRALQDDVPEDELCGAQAGRAMLVSEQYHALLLEGYGPIPQVEAGDTVWWHPDVIHGVEDKHQGSGYSNVIYIGAAPDCDKNRVFSDLQRAAFETGESSPDFAPEHYELGFEGRATVADLTELGRRQMGYA